MAFCVWLSSISVNFLKSIHGIAKIKFSSLLMAEQYCIVYLYHIWLLCSSTNGHLVCFHLLAVVNNVAMSIGMQMSVQVPPFNTFVFIYMLNSGIAESYGSCMFNCLRSHSVCTISNACSFQFLYILSSLVFPTLLSIAVIVDVKWYLTAVNFCRSLPLWTGTF